MQPEQCVLIRVYGDSLSMPRYREEIGFEATYPELLRAELENAGVRRRVHLYNRSRSGGNIATLYNDYHLDSFHFGPDWTDFLIIQCGVCDCAPRPIPPWLKYRIGQMRELFRSAIVWLIRKNRARLLRSGYLWRETPAHVFAANYEVWLRNACASARHVFALNIAPTTDAIDAHSPGFRSSIEYYNGLIADAVSAVDARNLTLIDVYGALKAQPEPLELYINAKDGHHITTTGHKFYCRLIMEKCAALLTQ